ncbi:CDGSH iron-sulfur domain-containing protein [Scopulibacillus cellulosilyticus]|uniref:CDGSH iron-sulfur domain-containing protein n=1 Tax=Scopulibacillus cellulosilyticus TaxID=2665665 RepID=A0ABW2PTS4_9BACL
MSEDKHDYESDDIVVSFYPNRCNHIGRCVRLLNEVFNPDNKPWVNLENADIEAVCRTIEQCPTGALQYQRLDGADGETAPDITTIKTVKNGPFFIHGNIELLDEEGNPLTENKRIALCRCGRSKNKPFCDGTHKKYH